MSKAQFDAFYKKVGEDEDLKKKLMELKGPGKEVYTKVVQLAKDEGFDVEPADFMDAFVKEGKLDDATIAQVAGGGNVSHCTAVCGTICSDNLGIYNGQQ